jgi:hypothetical protein
LRKEAIAVCPVCNGHLTVSQLNCKTCNIDITGEFELSKFDYMSRDDLRFIEVFLKSQGNLKDVQSELGLSYPTVKKMLEGVIRRLGYDVKDENPAVNENEILNMVRNKEISVEDAAELFRKGRS